MEYLYSNYCESFLYFYYIFTIFIISKSLIYSRFFFELLVFTKNYWDLLENIIKLEQRDV